MAVAEMSTIVQETTVRAPRSRVWQALTTPSQLSTWFHCTLDTHEFRVGDKVGGVSTYPGCEGKGFTLKIVEMVPNQRFAWNWRPGKSASPEEPETTVTFELEEIAGGTRVKVIETGFDRISLQRRAQAFEDNNNGWKIQIQNLRNYAEQNA